MLYIFTVFETLILCITLNKLFIIFKLIKRNYNYQPVPYSGGTIIFISLLLSFIFSCFLDRISFIKGLFFMAVTALVYLIGMLDDILGSSNIKGLKGNIFALISKKFSMGIIKAICVIAISCYIYYFFNEEFWILRGIVTALTTNLFNLFDLRPGRCIKLYYIFFTFFIFSNIRWTKELFIIFSIILTTYYFWDAYGFSMLGDSGSNLIGFIIGLIISEVLGTNLLWLIILLIILLILQLVLDKYSLTTIVQRNSFFNHVDRFLTERQGKEDVEP